MVERDQDVISLTSFIRRTQLNFSKVSILTSIDPTNQKQMLVVVTSHPTQLPDWVQHVNEPN